METGTAKTVRDAIKEFQLKPPNTKFAFEYLKSRGYTTDVAWHILGEFETAPVIRAAVFAKIRLEVEEKEREQVSAANNKQLTTPRNHAQALQKGFEFKGEFELGTRAGNFTYIHPFYKGHLTIPFKLGRPYRTPEGRKA